MARIGTVFIAVIGLLCCYCFFVRYTNKMHNDACNVKCSQSCALQIHQEKKTDSDNPQKGVKLQQKTFKSMSIKWPQRSLVLKEPNGTMTDNKPVISSASGRKCLADFNNPAESSFAMKCGDKRDAWHDARKGSLSPSCKLAMGKGGFQQKLSFAI